MHCVHWCEFTIMCIYTFRQFVCMHPYVYICVHVFVHSLNCMLQRKGERERGKQAIARLYGACTKTGMYKRKDLMQLMMLQEYKYKNMHNVI